MNGLIIYALGFALASCSSLLASGALAQGSIGASIQPALFEQTVDPGGSFTGVFRATNNEPYEKTFYFSVKDITRLNESGQPVFAEPGESTPYALSSWVILPGDSVTIAAGDTAEIPFSVSVPADISPGGHYGGIFLVSRPARPSETGAGVGYEVGTILNFRTAGEVVEEADIREFRTDKTAYGAPKVEFLTRVENFGNVIVRPRGFVEITNMLGRSVASVRVNNTAASVFPKSVRAFSETWEGSWWTFGRHQATLSLVYGVDVRKTLTATVSFWVLPLKIILPVLGTIAAVVLVLWVLVKLYIRRKLREMGAAAGKDAKIEPMIGQRTAPINRLVAVAITLLIFAALLIAALFVLLA